MGYEGGDLLLAGLPVAGAWSLCVQAVDGGSSGLLAQFSDESALEVCIHVMRYVNQHLYPFLRSKWKFGDICGMKDHQLVKIVLQGMLEGKPPTENFMVYFFTGRC